MSAQKTLQDVFPALSFDGALGVYKDYNVLNVKIARGEQILRLYLNGGQINEEASAELRAKLLSVFPNINDTEIIFSIASPDKRTTITNVQTGEPVKHPTALEQSAPSHEQTTVSPKQPASTAAALPLPAAKHNQAVAAAWNAVVRELTQIHPLCAIVLSESKWQIKDKELIIDIAENNAFHFTERGIDKVVSGIVKKLTGAEYHVRCMGNTSDAYTQQSVFSSSVQEKEHIKPAPSKPVFSPMPLKAASPPESAASAPIPMPKLKTAAPKTHKPQQNFKNTSNYKGRSKKTKVTDAIMGDITPLSAELVPDTEICVMGRIICMERREIKSQTHESLLVTADITDGTGSVTFKFFTKQDEFETDFKYVLVEHACICIKGVAKYDDYTKEVNIQPLEIASLDDISERADLCEEKRAELHLHTQMSAMDAVTSAEDYIKRAAKWGHKAIAVTDHGVVQAFPEAAAAAKKHKIKVIFGMEAYIVDDTAAARVVSGTPSNMPLSGEFIAFDIETTGLDIRFCEIIEIGAVRIKNLEITDTFAELIKPENAIPYNITQLTGIDDEMVKDKPGIKDVLSKFLNFIGDTPLIAHNANFDTGFIRDAAKKNEMEFTNAIIDTLPLSRSLYPELKKHKLDIVAQHLKISNNRHHRALSDAQVCAEVFIKASPDLTEKGVTDISGINAVIEVPHKTVKQHSHAVILVKNNAGLRSLYELVSDSHLKYFYRKPRILKSQLAKMRKGLLIGTACDSGELFTSLYDGSSEERVNELCEFYDYFEIQPSSNSMYLVRSGKLQSEADIIRINKEIVRLGERYGKPVCATSDAHFLDPGDAILRGIIQHSEGYKDADCQPPLYLKTTDEMLAEFMYLGESAARRVVIENTNLIADSVQNVKPIPDGTFPPEIPGSDEELRELALQRAKQIYGEPLPKPVDERLVRELDSIINNGFAVMYIAAQKLVAYSEEHGYLVGSRGSVGSSFAATMTGITEVNPLSPHYICPKCKYSDFDSETVKAFAGGSGCDMPDMPCPKCGENLKKDGHDIPFETFLGFEGDKEPDIDLNFSGEFQAKAHAYTEVLFGEGNVYKAGTISKLADNTAFAIVNNYMRDKGLSWSKAEINRLKCGLMGVKKSTGQHPGGLMILPKGHSIYEFTPVQNPANESSSAVITTHFSYKSISGRLLKLDILGHDAPTILRMLKDYTGIDPRGTDIGAKDIVSLFTSPDALGVTKADISSNTGSLGLPEFGTSFVRQMLQDTHPQTFAELVRISGLSHGENVWLNNAQDYIKNGQATLKTIIPTRDDILLYLIKMGLEKKTAFWIAESVRRGYGLKPDQVEEMQKNNVPEWYIESCKKIKYLFPKGHAVAYVMMSMRIGWYKIHHPYAFYAAMFSVRALDFDYELMCSGREKIETELRRINALQKNEATAKDKSALSLLELIREFYARGLKFAALNLYDASADKFVTASDGLLPPLCAVAGLGANAAQSIVEARKNGEFNTVEDFKKRTKVNKTVTELLKRTGVLNGLPETNQLSLM